MNPCGSSTAVKDSSLCLRKPRVCSKLSSLSQYRFPEFHCDVVEGKEFLALLYVPEATQLGMKYGGNWNTMAPSFHASSTGANPKSP